ncbi:hypothetical protein ABZ622_40365 [Streptomyces sp. NPDC007164]|uniref:ankyrin repeat domain-containing protein n=1 Tax=Streptomyces sp. NPDC007164 TaxID=3156918 RepID=UPI0033CBA74C
MSETMSESLFAAVTPVAGADSAERAARIRSLIADGADVSVRNERGATPLHQAVEATRDDGPLPSLEVIRALLECGADTAAVDGLGRTPLGLALRLPEADTVAVLRAAGAPAQVRYPVVEGGPLPIDMDTVRQVAGAMLAERATVREAAELPDHGGWLAQLVEPDLDSYQEFAAQLRHGIDPDLLGYVPELCAKALGGTGASRTLLGDQLVDTPFFHHGDLVVKGHLHVAAPFVLTGSLTVEGVLADCAPHSVMAVRGNVTARAVFTDGDVACRDIHAEVVYGSYNDHTLQAGRIRARLVIEDEHETIAAVEADLYFDQDDYQQGYGDGVQEQLRELLVDDVFAADEDDDEGEEMLDHELLMTRLSEGLPVFRADAAPEGRCQSHSPRAEHG